MTQQVITSLIYLSITIHYGIIIWLYRRLNKAYKAYRYERMFDAGKDQLLKDLKSKGGSNG